MKKRNKHKIQNVLFSYCAESIYSYVRIYVVVVTAVFYKQNKKKKKKKK